MQEQAEQKPQQKRPTGLWILFILTTISAGLSLLSALTNLLQGPPNQSVIKQMKAEMSFLVETIRTKNPDIYYNDMKNFILILKLIALNELKMCEIITETYNHRLSHISFLEQNGFLLSKKENSSLYHSLKRGQ